MSPIQHLSRRERQIMDLIYELSEASAKDIEQRLADPPSYSAIRATLNKLERKGVLKHREQDLKYVYYPTIDAEEARESAMKRVLKTFFEGSASMAMSKLLDVSIEHVSESELAQLQELIEQARQDKAKKQNKNK